MPKPTLCLLGPPGGGKGTQTQKLIEKFQAPQVVLGDLVREVRAKADGGDSFAQEVKKRYDAGIPQPDEVIEKMVGDKLADFDLSSGVIFDAFPLSAGQIKLLDRLVKKYDLSPPLILYFDISEEEGVKRLSLRRYCPKCKRPVFPGTEEYNNNICGRCGSELIVRPDDKEGVVRKRFKEYAERMKAIREYYEPRGQFIAINAKQTPEAVAQEIEEKLKERIKA